MMDNTWSRLISGTRRRLLFVVTLVVVALGGALTGYAFSASPRLTMPSTGVVTVTEFGASTPMDGSTQPRAVVLTNFQAATLRNRVSQISTMSVSADSLMCMENETVFTILVKAPHRPSRTVWTARAELCPAPGILYVYSKNVSNPKISRYCILKSLLLSYFPMGSVNGTKRMLGFC